MAAMQSSVRPLHGFSSGAGCCLAIIAMQSASIAIALGALAAVGTLRAAAIWAPKRPISAPIRSSEARRRFTIIASSKSALRNQTKFNLNGARRRADLTVRRQPRYRSEEHTSELQSLMRISYAVFCLKKKNKNNNEKNTSH